MSIKVVPTLRDGLARSTTVCDMPPDPQPTSTTKKSYLSGFNTAYGRCG